MSDLIPYQSCRRNEGWVPVNVASDSTKGLDYVVLVSPWGNPNDNICECPGYHFRGACKHQIIAMQKTCWWNELDGEPQTEEQRQNKVCPRCKGPTRWELQVVDE